jgi:hypothetical protein
MASKTTLPSQKQIPDESRTRQQNLWPAPIDDEIVDWDMVIATPFCRPTGRMQVRLVNAGRGKPLPVVEPHTE